MLAKVKKDKMAYLSTKLYKSNNCTLNIYKRKRNKKVSVLSSMHKTVTIEKDGKRIPETVRFYNDTKFGVDVTDQMARTNSVKSKSRRWPLQVFYNILDLAGINAWILYKDTTDEKITRQDFLLQLPEELAKEYQQIRQKDNMQEIIKENIHVRKTCQIGYCKKNKSNKICVYCGKYVCGSCVMEKNYNL